MIPPWEKALKERYWLRQPMEPIICPSCHRKFRARYERVVPYHRDNSDRGVCWGSRQKLHDSAYKYPRRLHKPPSAELAWYATRQLRRGSRIEHDDRSYGILRFTVERDRVHEALGYGTFAEYFQKEVLELNERRRREGGFWRRLRLRISSRSGG
jgi:hypothetical protein